jgi:hypothetical protein
MLRQQVVTFGAIGFMILNDVIRAEIMKAIDSSGSPSAKKALNASLADLPPGSPPVTISTEQFFGSSDTR